MMAISSARRRFATSSAAVCTPRSAAACSASAAASACFCECPPGLARPACTVRAAQATLRIVLQGAARAALPPAKLGRLLGLVASMAGLEAGRAECARIADGLVGAGRRADAGPGVVPALQVEVRLVCGSVTEAVAVGARLDQLRQASVLQQRLTDAGFGTPGQVEWPHCC